CKTVSSYPRIKTAQDNEAYKCSKAIAKTGTSKAATKGRFRGSDFVCGLFHEGIAKEIHPYTSKREEESNLSSTSRPSRIGHDLLPIWGVVFFSLTTGRSTGTTPPQPRLPPNRQVQG